MSYEVIVIGVGTFGAAACAALAARGVRVLGLERFSIPHDRGSYHGQSRMFRLAYFEHPDYVPLLRRAFDGWKALELHSGRTLFHVTGGLYCGEPSCDSVAHAAASARAHGLAHEVLTRGEIARRFPQFDLPDSFAGLYEPLAGFVQPEAAVAAMADLARRRGAHVRTGEIVKSWSADGKGARVETASGTYAAERLIIAAGAWTGALVRPLAPRLRVSRQVVGWVRPVRREPFARGRFPCWAVERDGVMHYGFPMLPGDEGLKSARHVPGPTADPDTLGRAPTPSDEAEFRAGLDRYLPDARGPTMAVSVCMYTNSPDGHFIIDRHPPLFPGAERTVIACGFSGHGFKFAPVVGEALADLAMTGRSEQPIGFLGLSRFGGAP